MQARVLVHVFHIPSPCPGIANDQSFQTFQFGGNQPSVQCFFTQVENLVCITLVFFLLCHALSPSARFFSISALTQECKDLRIRLKTR